MPAPFAGIAFSSNRDAGSVGGPGLPPGPGLVGAYGTACARFARSELSRGTRGNHQPKRGRNHEAWLSLAVHVGNSGTTGRSRPWHAHPHRGGGALGDRGAFTRSGVVFGDSGLLDRRRHLVWHWQVLGH